MFLPTVTGSQKTLVASFFFCFSENCWVISVYCIKLRNTISIVGTLPGPTTVSPGLEPGTPTNLYSKETTSSSITLAWDDVPDVAYYIVEYYRTVDYPTINMEYAYQNVLTFDRLEPDTEYNYRVIAANNYGSSGPSAILTVLTKSG